MKPDNTQTIGDIIEKTDEKARMFTDIHYRIMSLISAGTDNVNFDEIRKPLELLTEYDVYNNGKPSDFMVREIYKKAFMFLNQLERNKAKAATVTGTHKIDKGIRKLLLKNNDLTLLNETYKAFDNLNKSAIYRTAIEYHERCAPLVLSKQTTKVAILANKKSRDSARQKKANRIAELEPIKQIICELYSQELASKSLVKITATKFRGDIRKRISSKKLQILNLEENAVTDAEIEEWINEINRQSAKKKIKPT